MSGDHDDDDAVWRPFVTADLWQKIRDFWRGVGVIRFTISINFVTVFRASGIVRFCHAWLVC